MVVLIYCRDIIHILFKYMFFSMSMKEYIKHPFVKFMMVLVGIAMLALTTWVVFEVVDEIRDEVRGADDEEMYED